MAANPHVTDVFLRSGLWDQHSRKSKVRSNVFSYNPIVNGTNSEKITGVTCGIELALAAPTHHEVPGSPLTLHSPDVIDA